MNILNIGNFSFLVYNINSIPIENPVVLFLRYVRLPIAIISIFWVMTNGKISYYSRYISDLLVFLTYIFIQSFVNEGVLGSVSYALWFVGLVLLISEYLYMLRADKNPLDLIIKSLVVFNGIILILAIPSIPRIITLGGEAMYFSSKNVYSMVVMAYVVSASFYLSLTGWSRKNFLQLILITLGLVIMALSGKRMPFVLASIAVIVFLIYKNITLLIIPIVLVLIFSSFQNVQDYFADDLSNQSETIRRMNEVESLDELDNESSFAMRLILWEAYFNSFKERPFFGYGLNSAASARESWRFKSKLSYHNSFLQILVELGSLGMFLFLIFLSRTLYEAIIKITDKKVLIWYILLFLMTIIPNLFETNTLPGEPLFITCFIIWLIPRFLPTRSRYNQPSMIMTN